MILLFNKHSDSIVCKNKLSIPQITILHIVEILGSKTGISTFIYKRPGNKYLTTVKRNEFESVEMRWMNLEKVIQNDVSQKKENKYHVLMHIYGL